MGNVMMYIKEVVRNFPNLTPDQRESELSHIESIIAEAFKAREDSFYLQMQKLSRENTRLKTLLDVAADHIEDLRERLE